MTAASLAALVPKLRAKEYEAVSQRVAMFSRSDDETRWLGFASAWRALVYRLRAAHEHAESFALSLARSVAPPARERYRQERDLFVFATSAVSALECYFFAAYCIGAFAKPDGFAFGDAKDLVRVRPEGVRDCYVRSFPADALTRAMQQALAATEYNTVNDVRNVLSHRGVAPRWHTLSAEAGRRSAIPSNLKELVSGWRYDQPLTPTMLASYVGWLDQTINDLVAETARFTAIWRRESGSWNFR